MALKRKKPFAVSWRRAFSGCGDGAKAAFSRSVFVAFRRKTIANNVSSCFY